MSKVYHKHVNYKYTLTRDFIDNLGVYGYECETEFIRLQKDGTVFIKKNYSWDGCTRPALNPKSTRRGGLIHDVGYQLIRLRLLPKSCKDPIDTRFLTILKEDKFIGAGLYYFAVDKFASFALNPKEEPKEEIAP